MDEVRQLMRHAESLTERLARTEVALRESERLRLLVT